MCRMLAVLTKNDFDEDIYAEFLSLARCGNVKPYRSEGHHDGWGVSVFLGNTPVVFYKSPNDVISEYNHYRKAVRKAISAKSKFTIVHFRKASSGNVKIENTHPFVHNEWIFCHNGTILEKEKLRVNKNFCQGDTDSELVFNFIVENIGNEINFVKRLIEIIKYLRAAIKHTSYTFFLANNDYFVAYREYSNKFAEEGDSPLWNKDYYTLYYIKTKRRIIFCSQPIYKTKWIKFRNSQLIVVNKDLDIVFNKII